jgi:hypothetical protein
VFSIIEAIPLFLYQIDNLSEQDYGTAMPKEEARNQSALYRAWIEARNEFQRVFSQENPSSPKIRCARCLCGGRNATNFPAAKMAAEVR